MADPAFYCEFENRRYAREHFDETVYLNFEGMIELPVPKDYIVLLKQWYGDDYMTGIVILNYNDSKTTSEMLDKIKSFKTLNHIVVVDNNSSDDSLKVLEKYKSEKIDIVANKENKGYAYGNNVGIRYLRDTYKCDYVFISNPDIIVSEETIKKY